MTSHGEEIERVRERIARHVLAFLRERGKGGEFHANELREYVDARCAGAPGSADRILRDLRQRDVIGYTLVSRRDSLYRVEKV